MTLTLILGLVLFSMKAKRVRRHKEKGLKGLFYQNPWLRAEFWDEDRQCWTASLKLKVINAN